MIHVISISPRGRLLSLLLNQLDTSSSFSVLGGSDVDMSRYFRDAGRLGFPTLLEYGKPERVGNRTAGAVTRKRRTVSPVKRSSNPTPPITLPSLAVADGGPGRKLCGMQGERRMKRRIGRYRPIKSSGSGNLGLGEGRSSHPPYTAQ